MGENTAIEWADHSFSPWRGCTKVSPGCDNCYAENIVHRFGGGWGPGQPRQIAAESTWKLPLRWNRKAEREGVRFKVFPSLCDPFDAEVPDEWRDRLFALTALTRNLDWLLLTKRPMVALRYLGRRALPSWPLPNVWLGTSVENQKMADLRIPTLLEIPAAKHFLSCEPLLGPVDISYWTTANNLIDRPGLSWVITGGESGPKARPMHPDWARSIRDQCVDAGVPYFFKQWGEWAPGTGFESGGVPAKHWNAAAGGFIDGLGDRSNRVVRIGKKAAGRLLDGRTWDEVPA